MHLRCKLLGHRYRFASFGETMAWRCSRGCGASGAKVYPTAAEARRYARSFDREDRATTGRRAPLIALLPLRLGGWLLSRLRRTREAGAAVEVRRARPAR